MTTEGLFFYYFEGVFFVNIFQRGGYRGNRGGRGGGGGDRDRISPNKKTGVQHNSGQQSGASKPDNKQPQPNKENLKKSTTHHKSDNDNKAKSNSNSENVNKSSTAPKNHEKKKTLRDLANTVSF